MARNPRADQQLDKLIEAEEVKSAAQNEREIPIAPADERADDVSAQRVDDAGAETDDDPLAALQRSYEEMKTEAERHKQEAAALKAQAAEHARSADAYRRQAEESSVEVRKASVAAIDSAIAHTKSNIVGLKQEIARAAEAQEWDTFAEAQEALAQNTVYLQQLNENKGAVETKKESAPTRAPASSGGDGVEAFINTCSLRSQTWLRAHKDDVFSSDARKARAQAAHIMAVDDGFAPDSDGYFAELDRHMGYSKADQNRPTPQQKPSGAMPSAPPARTNPGAAKSNEVRMTREQIDAAVAIFSDKSREDAIALYAEQLKQIRGGKTHLMESRDKYRGGYNGI